MQVHNQFSTIEMSPAVIHQIMARISTHTVVATTNSGREKTVDQDTEALLIRVDDFSGIPWVAHVLLD